MIAQTETEAHYAYVLEVMACIGGRHRKLDESMGYPCDLSGYLSNGNEDGQEKMSAKKVFLMDKK
ncbi:MAG: hypothetical protein KF793_05210 [Nitrospira sp.]|nr:hypothetical protein [Nitrospira sp.]